MVLPPLLHPTPMGVATPAYPVGLHELLLDIGPGIYDPWRKFSSSEKSWRDLQRWGCPGGEAEEMATEPGKKVSIKIHPWEYVVMASPTMHSVARITKGERLSLVAFFGMSN